MQVWEAIGGKEYFMSIACHDMLKEHSEEVRGATLPNFVGDRVFNGIFAERKPSQSVFSLETCLGCAVALLKKCSPKLQAANILCRRLLS